MNGLEERLRQVASAPSLLVAIDFDGTLSEIVDIPSDAVPVAGAIEALALLAASPATTVALVSGRVRADLAARASAPDSVLLVGSHGAEVGEGTPEHERLGEVLAAVERMVPPEVLIEEKPATVTVHTRALDDTTAERLVEEIRALGGRLGCRVEEGKRVVELHLSETTKGTALGRLREQLGAEAVVYVGDDTTDEEAFAVLGERDLAVKVGPGETLASFRVAAPTDVVTLLERLARMRPGRVGPGSR